MKRTIKFLPLAAMTFVIMACAPKGNAYHVTFDTTGGSWKASQTAYDSVDYKATFTPDEGHALDEKKLAIKVAGATIIDGYTFFDNQLTIDKKMITGDVVIRATADALTYGVNFKVEGVVPSYSKPTYHKEFVCTVSNSYERYLLPTEFHVAVNGTELKEGVTYTRGGTGETGKIVVDASKVEGDITISGNPIKSAQVTFNGNGGKWGIDDSVDVYLPEGSTFKDAKTKATDPTNEDLSQSLRRWVIKGTDKTVSDNMVLDLNNPLEVEAKWTTKTFSLNIEDSYRYFPTDYYRKKIDYGTSSADITINLAIDSEDRDSHYLPENGDGITVEMATSPTTQIPFQYIPRTMQGNRVVVADLLLKGPSPWDYKNIEADVTVKIAAAPYQTLKVTFDPGDGHWSSESSDPEVVSLPNDRNFTILEASLKADNMQMPVSNDPSRIFKCWTLDGVEVDNENKFINSSVTYKAKYEDITFQNDTWKHVIEAANQGTEYLFSRYSNLNETNIIGTRRKVLIGNPKAGHINVIARVIGVNHDKIVGGSGAKAALTFEFEDTFGQGIVGGEPIGVPFSTSDDRDYKNSTVRNLLNDQTSGLISMVPDVLQENIKEVIKTTKNKSGSSEDLADRFFLLSANEIGLTHEYMPEGVDVPEIEGSPYAYYSGAKPADRVKGSQIVQDNTYWIRTVSNHEDCAYAIDGNGDCTNEAFITPHGVAPAFAIGIDTYTYSDVDGTINYTNCYSTIDKFKVGANTDGGYYALKVTARDGYIFEDSIDVVEVTNCTLGYKVVSDDGSTLTCSFTYTAEQTKQPISVAIKTETQGKSAHFKLNNCTTTAKTDFAVVANQDGTVGTGIVFTAMDGYTFDSSEKEHEIFDYNSIIYDIENVKVSDDLKTLTCDIKYVSTTLEGLADIDITVKTQNYELSYIKLNAENCTSEFKPIVVKTGDEIKLTVKANEGCEFEKIDGKTLEEQYKRSINVTAPASMGVTYTIEEVKGKAKQELNITLSYKATSDQLSDITINAIASKNGSFTVSGNNCMVDGAAESIIPYYCGKSATFNIVATAKEGYTFLDLYDTEIVKLEVDTLRGSIKTVVSVSEDGKTANITITLDGTATREGNKLGFSVHARETR